VVSHEIKKNTNYFEFFKFSFQNTSLGNCHFRLAHCCRRFGFFIFNSLRPESWYNANRKWMAYFFYIYYFLVFRSFFGIFYFQNSQRTSSIHKHWRFKTYFLGGFNLFTNLFNWWIGALLLHRRIFPFPDVHINHGVFGEFVNPSWKSFHREIALFRIDKKRCHNRKCIDIWRRGLGNY